jgi:hypothetical protein
MTVVDEELTHAMRAAQSSSPNFLSFCKARDQKRRIRKSPDTIVKAIAVDAIFELPTLAGPKSWEFSVEAIPDCSSPGKYLLKC